MLDDDRQRALPARQQGGYDALGVMEQHLVSHDYFVGPQPSIADITLHAYTHIADEGGFGLDPFPAIQHWLGRIKSPPRYIPITQG